MSKQRSTLPDFTKPPVVEVALSVQFDALADLGAVQLGLLWSQFRDRFPKVEEHPPLDPSFEQFGVRGSPSSAPRLRILTKPPSARCWFLNEEGTELIQVQSDRFVHNWRKADTSQAYPRYKHVRETFKRELEVFHEFLSSERLGQFKPNQCEVTYVNHILSGAGWENHGQLDKIFTVLTHQYSDTFLSSPEDARIVIDYVIPAPDGTPLGRLHVSAEPACRAADDKPILILKLTARGRLTESGLNGVFSTLDLGREWVVRGFASITEPEMHAIWGRTDVHR
ncbi:MAG: TIGR04255 family protein [Phycisphaerae bacterium]|nr:TIGR04255 family protein [Phycisphaerae bacterium]